MQSLPTVFRNLSEDTSRLTCAPQDCMSVSVRSSPLSTTWGLPDLKHLRMRLITSYTLRRTKRAVAKRRDKKRRKKGWNIQKWWQRERWPNAVAKSTGKSGGQREVANVSTSKRWQKAVARVVSKVAPKEWWPKAATKSGGKRSTFTWWQIDRWPKAVRKSTG